MTDTEAPTRTITDNHVIFIDRPVTIPTGMTGDALRAAQRTMTKLYDEISAGYHRWKKLHDEHMELQADRDALWNKLYMPDGEISRLRAELAQANELIAELQSQNAALRGLWGE